MSIIWMLLAHDDVISFGKIKFFFFSQVVGAFSLFCAAWKFIRESVLGSANQRNNAGCVRVAVDTSMYRASVVEARCRRTTSVTQ